MSLMFYSPIDDPGPWREALGAALPDLEFRVWPDDGPLDNVHYTLVWKPPIGWHRQFPDLRAILSLGAGVDAIVADPDLPPDVPIARLRDAGMAQQMAEYALYGALHFHRRMDEYARQQVGSVWQPLAPKLIGERGVGVMGLGVLGSAAAAMLARTGFKVAGWSRTRHQLDGIACWSGFEDFERFLAGSEILINFLPLTPDTLGILDAATLVLLPRGACIVNSARGAHVVEADLLAALDNGQIRGAMLDVFAEEPLPALHPLWRHPGVIVTPHVAAVTIASEAAGQVIDNLRRLRRGEAPVGVVDRAAGY